MRTSGASATVADRVALTRGIGAARSVTSATTVYRSMPAAAVDSARGLLLAFPEGTPLPARPSFDALDALLGLKDGWNGYDAPRPSSLAVGNARTLLEHVHARGMTASDIVASIDGGVVVSFRNPQGDYADIECFNDGQSWGIVALMAGPMPKAWPVSDQTADIVRALEHIRATVVV